MFQEALDLFDAFRDSAVRDDKEGREQAFQSYILLQPLLTAEERQYLSLLRIEAPTDEVARRDFLEACRIVRERLERD